MESSEDRPVILDIYSTREQALRSMCLLCLDKQHSPLEKEWLCMRSLSEQPPAHMHTRSRPNKLSTAISSFLYLHQIETTIIEIELTPVHKWDNGKDGYIGCSIRFCLFDTISDVVWHILVRICWSYFSGIPSLCLLLMVMS